jgi:hypothetical protein
VRLFNNLSGLVAGYRDEKDYCFKGRLSLFFSLIISCGIHIPKDSLKMVITVLSTEFRMQGN